MAISLRKEMEPQEDNGDNLPLHAVVYEPKVNQFLENHRTDRNNERPIEPVEPEAFSLNELEWKRYEKRRDAARKYAEENDLRGTF